MEHQFNMLIREIRKEYVGNGPKEIHTRFVDNWAISEMKGNLTNVENFMISSRDGQRMVHEARTKLVKQIYKNPTVLKKIEDLVNAKIVSIFTDIDLDIDTAMTIYVFDKPVQG
ncbi:MULTISPECIES: DUF2294 domain-containing protein [Bacillaceae]|uniref:Na+-translocating membrane potential-generating system MpsC domain-containing protein n=1 Tax=Peribacillus simplex TaxID=1478 RepID=A0A120GNF5_9BACI|nr:MULTISPECIES: DUF2294 domain-containing protein [Bacillaceae]KWW15500.1 hypothetical protein AS888_08190 [Peribacillus simplex]PJN90345.1 DUF2294 domain-containing protein [Bacillus sp. mrc49]